MGLSWPKNSTGSRQASAPARIRSPAKHFRRASCRPSSAHSMRTSTSMGSDHSAGAVLAPHFELESTLPFFVAHLSNPLICRVGVRLVARHGHRASSAEPQT